VSSKGDRSGTPGGARKITLYGPTRIPFTEKVRRALLYKGLEFDLMEPSGPEDYRRWNPRTGLLPVLEIDGQIYPDSTDILFKLDESFPDPPLLSSDARISAQQKQFSSRGCGPAVPGSAPKPPSCAESAIASTTSWAFSAPARSSTQIA
jgi:hypothetical protein